MKQLNRREALGILSAAGSALVLGTDALAADEQAPRRTKMGIVTYAFGIHQKNNWAGRHGGLSPALALLEEARALNSAGIQVDLSSADAAQAEELRRRADAYGMYVEASISPPKSAEDLERFEKSVVLAQSAGARLGRTVILPGRRYEEFKSLEQFRQAEQNGLQSLKWAEPVLARHRFFLGVENHKDQRIAEKIAVLKTLGSEFIGLCVDVGNSFTLMEDPLEVARAYAPYAFTVHFKDQAVRAKADGFWFADVPLGEGFLDLHALVKILRDAKPGVHLNLEVITRDPLDVPCLKEEFWVTMPDTPASKLAHALSIVKNQSASQPFIELSKLPVEQQLSLELSNVRQSLAFARDHLGLL
jgi:sugar phosphate isomerase/epimerase